MGHVRANLTYAGFTFAPLKGTRGPHDGQECLVTMVVKMDFGGWLDASTWGGYFMESSRQAWIEHVLMTVVALRDKVSVEDTALRVADVWNAGVLAARLWGRGS